MLDPLLFAHHLARLVDLLLSVPGSVEDWQAMIGPPPELSGQQSATMRLAHGLLSGEHTAVPEERAYIPGLIARMRAHDIAAIPISFNAAPQDLLQLAQAL